MWTNIKRVDDEADNVAKFVFTKKDAVVESVLYKYPTYEERTVICCSTQSGCPVGCRFCGTGDYFVRNLTHVEIVEQVIHSVNETGLSGSDISKLQIMFMSMGEPLLNLGALIPAMEELYYLYPHARLLISTSAPKINHRQRVDLLRASVGIPTIGLQFSVHESTNEARDRLVPFKAKMTLEEIARAGEEWYYYVGDGRKPFFNYCAHAENSSNEDADRIAKLYYPRIFNATVSVICERNEGMPATNDYQRQLATDFSAKLVERGYDTRVFDPAGQDTIGGGCGQLWFVQNWMKENPSYAKPTAGFGLPEVHVPAVHPQHAVSDYYINGISGPANGY
jgi:23S rRNA (adenine2503-C2)-methyltransferase